MNKISVSFPGLGIDTFELNKVAFTLFGKIEVRWYGIIITCGILLAFLYAMFRGKKNEGVISDDVSLVKHTAQVPGYACGLALVQIDHSGFPVGVGVKFRRRMHDAFRVVDEIGVVRQVGFRIRLYHGHQPFVLRHFLLVEVLLQDNQVAAHLRTRVVRE